MTGEQIIKALEFCYNRKNTVVLVRYNDDDTKSEITVDDIFEVINTLQRKIKAFEQENVQLREKLKETTEKFNCQQYVYADLSDIIRDKNAEIERLKLITTNKPYCVSIGTADIFTENHEEYEKLLARISA